jgi:D-glycero-D-manno-heptose 1,7-bisphosphate phosphatase
MKKEAVFLDRDGTLNVEKGYLFRLENWEWIPGAVEAIIRINRMGFIAVVVTNQAGIARGYYADAAVLNLHQGVDKLLARAGAYIDAYYYCPHHPEYGAVRECTCRKPSAGLLFKAQLDHNIDLSRSWLIGDKMSDVEAGFRAGVRPILVQTGYGAQEIVFADSKLRVEKDVLSAVRHIELVRHGHS